MKMLAWVLCTSAGFFLPAALPAEEPSPTPSSRTVGSVLGKPVTAADLGLTAPIDPTVKFDARDTARWRLMGRVMTTFGGPIMDRFVREQKIEATAEEIEQFQRKMQKTREQNFRAWEARLAELNQELAAAELSEADRARREEERTRYERLLASRLERPAAEAPDELARMFLVAWKVERELHRAYGGRVIFQQAGPEALDARRRLFEQAEKNGDLHFADPGVRHLFYYYAHMRHTTIDEKVLERSWLLDDKD